MTHSEILIKGIFQRAYDPFWMNNAWHGERVAKDVDGMLVRVRRCCETVPDWQTEEVKKVCQYILSKLGTEKLYRYAEKVFRECSAFEWVPKDVGRSQRSAELRSADAKRKAMEKKPVSEGQLKFLKILGFTGLVANSWEASQKIDELQKA